MSYTIDLLQHRSFIQAFGPYPILLPLLYIPVVIFKILYLMLVNHLTSVDSLTNFLSANGLGYIHIVSRWYSVFFGTATIFLVYKISNLIFKSRLSGYFAALVYAVSLAPLAMAHWGKAHTVMVFFFILSLFYALKYEEKKEIRFFYLSVLTAGFSLSIHYIGIASFIFPLTALIFNWKLIDRKIIIKSFLISLTIVIVFFGPNIKGMSNMFARDIGKITGNNFMGMFPAGNLERFYYEWRDSFMVEPIFVALFVILLLFKGKKIWGNVYIRYVLIGLAFYYLLMATVFAAPFIIRWLLAFIILLIIISAGYLADYLSKTKLPPKIIWLILLILILPNAFFSYRWNMLLNDYTRNEAAKWLESNLSRDEVAYSFDFYLDVPLSYKAARWQKEKNMVTGSKKIDYILNHKENYLNHGVNLLYDLGFERYEELGGSNTKYIINAYWESGAKNKRYDIPTRQSTQEIIEKVKKYHRIELKQIFYPTENKKLIETGVNDYLNNPLDMLPLVFLDKSGPFIEIYEVLK
ncbi:MAG: glycosyltransferase family 39 protein [Parcubacteria group bacterium]